jgi:hypothetical protein
MGSVSTQVLTTVKLAKDKSMTARTVLMKGTEAEECGVGVPLPSSNLDAAKVSNRLHAELYFFF